MTHGLSRHRGPTLRRRDDELCAQLLGLLCHLADTLTECQGCGRLAAPDLPCPTCAARRAVRP